MDSSSQDSRIPIDLTFTFSIGDQNDIKSVYGKGVFEYTGRIPHPKNFEEVKTVSKTDSNPDSIPVIKTEDSQSGVGEKIDNCKIITKLPDSSKSEKWTRPSLPDLMKLIEDKNIDNMSDLQKLADDNAELISTLGFGGFNLSDIISKAEQKGETANDLVNKMKLYSRYVYSAKGHPDIVVPDEIDDEIDNEMEMVRQSKNGESKAASSQMLLSSEAETDRIVDHFHEMASSMQQTAIENQKDPKKKEALDSVFTMFNKMSNDLFSSLQVGPPNDMGVSEKID